MSEEGKTEFWYTWHISLYGTVAIYGWTNYVVTGSWLIFKSLQLATKPCKVMQITISELCYGNADQLM